jgi:heterotetrameric sarcosine oxidase gamma subunit
VRYQVEVRDCDDRAVISLRASGTAVCAIEQAIGITVPALGRSVEFGETQGSLLGVGPDEWLLTVGREREKSCFDQIESAVAGHHASVIVMTDGYVCSTLSGNDALAVLAQVCGIDLHPDAFGDGAVARTAFAKVSAVIHCLEVSRRYEIYTDVGLRAYVTGYLDAAAGAGSLPR